MSRLPTLFIPHGGGPCFFVNWDPPDTWHRMAEYLRRVPEDAGERPKALVVVSGHWEEKVAAMAARHRQHPEQRGAFKYEEPSGLIGDLL